MTRRYSIAEIARQEDRRALRRFFRGSSTLGWIIGLPVALVAIGGVWVFFIGAGMRAVLR